MDYVEGISNLNKENITSLYNSVGWSIYTENINDLFLGIQNSTYVLSCFNENILIGLARCISDHYSICYLQDILVNPEYQGNKIGRNLLLKCLEKFKHVRTHILLTDNDEKQLSFYKSLGYKNINSLTKHKFNVFIQIKNTELI